MPKESRIIVPLLGILIFLTGINLIGCKESTNTIPVGSATLVTEEEEPTIVSAEVQGSLGLSGYVKDSGGNAIQGVKVQLHRDDLSGGSTFTTAEGKFFFKSVNAGYFTIDVPANSTYRATSYAVYLDTTGVTSPATISITLLPVLTANPTFLIEGYVKTASFTKPVGGVYFQLRGPSNVSYTTYSTSEGKFSFTDLATGDYTLDMLSNDLYLTPPSQYIKIAADGTNSPSNPVQVSITAKSVESYQIPGVVKLSTTREPLPLIAVKLHKARASNINVLDFLQETITSGEGKFFFEGLTSGLYYVFADGSPSFGAATFPVRILSNGTISPTSAEILLNRGEATVKLSVASGTIRDAFSGAPLEYVTCNLKGYASVLTDRDGWFNFQALGPLGAGKYELELSKKGFNTLTVYFTISELGQYIPASLDSVLIYSQESTLGSISGRYSDPTTGVPTGGPYFVSMYRMILVKKQTGLQALQGATYEEYWEYDDPIEPLKVTKTGTDTAQFPGDESGTFKLTHLKVTETRTKYLVFVGTTSAARPGYYNHPVGIANWKRPIKVATDPTQIHFWNLVDVAADTTTYLANYDVENK